MSNDTNEIIHTENMKIDLEHTETVYDNNQKQKQKQKNNANEFDEKQIELIATESVVRVSSLDSNIQKHENGALLEANDETDEEEKCDVYDEKISEVILKCVNNHQLKLKIEDKYRELRRCKRCNYNNYNNPQWYDCKEKCGPVCWKCANECVKKYECMCKNHLIAKNGISIEEFYKMNDGNIKQTAVESKNKKYDGQVEKRKKKVQQRDNNLGMCVFEKMIGQCCDDIGIEIYKMEQHVLEEIFEECFRRNKNGIQWISREKQMVKLLCNLMRKIIVEFSEETEAAIQLLSKKLYIKLKEKNISYKLNVHNFIHKFDDKYTFFKHLCEIHDEINKQYDTNYYENIENEIDERTEAETQFGEIFGFECNEICIAVYEMTREDLENIWDNSFIRKQSIYKTKDIGHLLHDIILHIMFDVLVLEPDQKTAIKNTAKKMHQILSCDVNMFAQLEFKQLPLRIYKEDFIGENKGNTICKYLSEVHEFYKKTMSINVDSGDVYENKNRCYCCECAIQLVNHWICENQDEDNIKYHRQFCDSCIKQLDIWKQMQDGDNEFTLGTSECGSKYIVNAELRTKYDWTKNTNKWIRSRSTSISQAQTLKSQLYTVINSMINAGDADTPNLLNLASIRSNSAGLPVNQTVKQRSFSYSHAPLKRYTGSSKLDNINLDKSFKFDPNEMKAVWMQPEKLCKGERTCFIELNITHLSIDEQLADSNAIGQITLTITLYWLFSAKDYENYMANYHDITNGEKSDFEPDWCPEIQFPHAIERQKKEDIETTFGVVKFHDFFGKDYVNQMKKNDQLKNVLCNGCGYLAFVRRDCQIKVLEPLELQSFPFDCQDIAVFLKPDGFAKFAPAFPQHPIKQFIFISPEVSNLGIFSLESVIVEFKFNHNDTKNKLRIMFKLDRFWYPYLLEYVFLIASVSILSLSTYALEPDAKTDKLATVLGLLLALIFIEIPIVGVV
eukprot:515909_1